VKPREFQKIPPQAAFGGFLVTASSVLTLHQLEIGECQKTSGTKGALGGWILILRALRIANSVMSTAEDFFKKMNKLLVY